MQSDCLLLLLFFRSTLSEPCKSLSVVLKDVARNSNLGCTRWGRDEPALLDDKLEGGKKLFQVQVARRSVGAEEVKSGRLEEEHRCF